MPDLMTKALIAGIDYLWLDAWTNDEQDEADPRWQAYDKLYVCYHGDLPDMPTYKLKAIIVAQDYIFHNCGEIVETEDIRGILEAAIQSVLK